MGYPIYKYTTNFDSPVTPIIFYLVSSTDHISAATGKSPIVTISKNGGSWTTPSGGINEIGNGWYQVSGNVYDYSALGVLLLHASGTGTDPVDDCYPIVGYSTRDTVRMALSALPNYAVNTSGGLPVLGGDLGVHVEDRSVREIASGVWTANTSDYSGINGFGFQLQPIYYADIKQLYNANSARDEYCVNWYRGHQILGSGQVTDCFMSTYTTISGTAVFENMPVNYSGTSNGSMIYYNSTNILNAGDPYQTIVSGTIDGSVRRWQKIIGRNRLY